jgi:hypothetical protein
MMEGREKGIWAKKICWTKIISLLNVLALRISFAMGKRSSLFVASIGDAGKKVLWRKLSVWAWNVNLSRSYKW